jgi:hypothetical protein
MGTPAPQVIAPRGTVEGDQAALTKEVSQKPFLESVYSKIHGSEFGQNHPVAGRVLGALAQVPATAADIALTSAPLHLGQLTPGTTAQKGARLGALTGEVKQEEANRKTEAETGEQRALGALHGAQAAGAEPIEVTPEMAAEINAPELAGQRMAPAVWQHLATNAATNKTKESTTQENIKSKEKIAGERNDTQLTIAQMKDMQKVQPHITTVQDGKPHVMERDPQTGEYSIDRGVAPANYASVLPQMLATKTTEMLGDDGVMHRYQYNPATKHYSEDIGAVPSGQAGHQIFQGMAIQDLAPRVIADIQAHKEVMGNLGAYAQQALMGTPIADPDAARIIAEIQSLAATQPAMHAFRSTNALQAFEKMIGGLATDPDATIESIHALEMTTRSFTELPKKGGKSIVGGGGGEGNPVGTTSKPDGVYEMDGKKYRVKGGNVYAQ